jgi:hypothetical protein
MLGGRSVAHVAVCAACWACGGTLGVGDSGAETAGDSGAEGSYHDSTAGMLTDGGTVITENDAPGSEVFVPTVGGPLEEAGGPIDAGYYHGDGAFFVDGGAYPGTLDASGATDAMNGPGDASSGCAALAGCCPSLAAASQSLCNAIAGLGDATNCSTELAQLQGAGDCTGVATLASEIQVPPNWLVSDGTLLFWTTKNETPGLLCMPVGGGAITILLEGPITNENANGFLAVDDMNVYLLQNSMLMRLPKNGAPASLVNESGAVLAAVSALGGVAYWVENGPGANYGDPMQPMAIKSAPLRGGPVSPIALFGTLDPISAIAVTESTILYEDIRSFLYAFPIGTGVPAGGPTAIAAATRCTGITSDTSAIYCGQTTGSNLGIAGDGTTTALGPAVSSSYIVYDDTYVYWADDTTVGTIMKAPKTGGNAAILARDATPTAIAVDAKAVYWSDTGGFIKSIPK